MKRLWQKYREQLLYVLFGGLTTLVNIVAYYLCATPLGLGTVPSTGIAWVLSVLFAYVTNRRWVFESHARGTSAIAREMGAFFLCRLLSGLMDMAIMYVFVDMLRFDGMVVKVASNVLVIIVNYVASKLLIFRNR